MILNYILSLLTSQYIITSPLIFNRNHIEYKELNTIEVVLPFFKSYANTPFKQIKNNDFEVVNLNPIAQYLINYTPSEVLEQILIQSVDSRSQSNAKKITKFVFNISKELEIDPFLIFSIIWTESDFKPRAKSNKGAYGFMQIMPNTKKFIKKYYSKTFPILEKKLKDNLLNKEERENIILGSLYIKFLLKEFQNNPYITIAAYNMGHNWAINRLIDNKEVGVNNIYVSKVKKRYQKLCLNY